MKTWWYVFQLFPSCSAFVEGYERHWISNIMSSSSRLHRLASWPPWISRWLGYRVGKPETPSVYIVWLWSFLGTFLSISVLQAVFGNARYFIERDVPSVVVSYGASAVLIYGEIDGRFAQPRALVGGYFIGTLTGICITKLFHLLPTEERFNQVQWVAGSLSVAVSIILMQLTSTTHPPAGAIALMSVVNEDIRSLGWYFLPVILLSTSFVLILALILNNIQRRYPIFWFRPDDDDTHNSPERHIQDTCSINDSIASSGQRTIVPYASERDRPDTHSINHAFVCSLTYSRRKLPVLQSCLGNFTQYPSTRIWVVQIPRANSLCMSRNASINVGYCTVLDLSEVYDSITPQQ